MEWFNIKEKSAGEKRLLISWYLYKVLGTRVLLLIAFFVTLITLLTNRDLRTYSGKYFEALYSYTGEKKYKPSFLNSLRHVLSYAESLVYKMEAFAGTYNVNDICFPEEEAGQKFFNQMKDKEGLLFICNHIGNIDIMKAFLSDYNHSRPSTVSVFLQKEHCKTFNNFINSLETKKENLRIYPIEEFDVTTISELDDNLKDGGIAFIAGDRIASNNPDRCIEADFMNKRIHLPVGTFKLAEILNYKTYFISCIRNKHKYDVYLEEQSDNSANVLQKNFTKFLEKMVQIAPYQFYHFYDIFM